MDLFDIAKEQHEALNRIRELLKKDFQNLNLPYALSIQIYEWLIDTKDTIEHYQKWLNSEKITETNKP